MIEYIKLFGIVIGTIVGFIASILLILFIFMKIFMYNPILLIPIGIITLAIGITNMLYKEIHR
jgi:hypothetical protein